MKISVNTEKLRHLSSKFASESSELSGVNRSVRNLVESLDWEVRQKAQTESRLQDLLVVGSSLDKKSESLTGFLINKAEAFIRADSARTNLIEAIGEPLCLSPVVTFAGNIVAFLNLFVKDRESASQPETDHIDFLIKDRINGFEKTPIDDDWLSILFFGKYDNEEVLRFLEKDIPPPHLQGIEKIEYIDGYYKNTEGDEIKDFAGVYFSTENIKEEAEAWISDYHKQNPEFAQIYDEFRPLWEKFEEHGFEELTAEEIEITWKYRQMLDSNPDFLRILRSEDEPIRVYLPGADDKNELQDVLRHEVGHNCFFHFLSEEQQVEWTTKISNPETVMEDYGSMNSQEDFATCYEAYITDNDKLKDISPEKHEWLRKNVFSYAGGGGGGGGSSAY